MDSMTTATTECSSTAASITEVLLGGDLILNLSGQALATAHGARYLQFSSNSGSGCSLQVTKEACCVTWNAAIPSCFSSLLSVDADRIVVVVESANEFGHTVVRELTACGLRCLLCTLSEDCGAEAFMDEEDAEAVAERLRQLGYL
ncbi:MAG: hypothetical protein ACK5AN_00940 [Planctomyces sp.]|jgi:pyrimidine deaminase RibD-like protein